MMRTPLKGYSYTILRAFHEKPLLAHRVGVWQEGAIHPLGFGPCEGQKPVWKGVP